MTKEVSLVELNVYRRAARVLALEDYFPDKIQKRNFREALALCTYHGWHIDHQAGLAFLQLVNDEGFGEK